MLVTFIDHYDSFSLNIVDWLIRFGFAVEYCKYDEPGMVDYFSRSPRPLVLSPGPFSPSDYPETLRLISNIEGLVPVFGVCLGFQMLGSLHSARVSMVSDPFHGGAQFIEWKTFQFRNSTPTVGISYNSLELDTSGCGSEIEVLAINSVGGVQCARFKTKRAKYSSLGVQFHPESFAGNDYDFLLDDFVEQVRNFECTSGDSAHPQV